MEKYILPIFTGLASGMVTYLTASGMSLIMSGMGTVNFGQGAVYILGGLLANTITRSWGLPFWVAMVVGFLVTFLLGIIVEVLLRPLQGKDMAYTLLVTMGISYILCDVMVFFWGSSIRTVVTPEALRGSVKLTEGVFIPVYYVFVIIAAAIVAIAFWIMFKKTRLGYYFRAVISDRSMVECLGINVQVSYTLMFMIGIGLGGLGGVLNAPLGGITPKTGLGVFTTIMPILIIGGINNLSGALPASLVLGLLNAFAAIIIPKYYNVVPFAFMVLVMFFKPNGLFTRKEN